MHHAGKNGPELLHIDTSFLITVQLNLLPTGTGCHLLSQMVAVRCHYFFFVRWSRSWDRDVVRVATTDVEGWGREVVVMNVMHSMNVVVVHVVVVHIVDIVHDLVVHIVDIVQVVYIVVIYDRFWFGSNICGMVVKMIMLFRDHFFFGICVSFCVHLVDLIIDVVWQLSFRNLCWLAGARHVIGGEDAEREQGLR